MDPLASNSLVQAAALVMDTNVVLDWLVFRDPSCARLGADMAAGRLRWCATQAMRDELEQVLTRPHILVRQANPSATLAEWDHTVVLVAPAAESGNLRCTDPDDQKFIDLALQLSPATLLSRDRAVLSLARQAGQLGVDIITAAAWAAERNAKLSG